MEQAMDRRTFVKGSLAAGLALTAGAGMAQTAAPQAPGMAIPSSPLVVKEPIPTGKIGNYQVGRMLLGGNLLTHTTHSRDLNYVSNLAAHYNTDEKLIETLRVAEEHGINTLTVHTIPRVMNVLRKYRREGGKIQWIIGPYEEAMLEPGLARFKEIVRQLVDDGCEMIYLTGFSSDPLVQSGKGEMLAEAIEIIKLNGVPAGVGAHDLAVIEYCEKHGVANDFYVKTFHHLNYPTAPRPNDPILKWQTAEIPGYWCNDPSKTIEVMKQVKKPWIAFKVMAAGAIPPEEAFRYAFGNGADFCLAGMFDYEIAPDAAIINKILRPELPKRERPWRA